MRSRFITVAVVAVLAFAAPALAHDDYRVIGTITKVAGKTLAVKQTKDGKTISMTMDEATLVTRDKKKVGAVELKPGLSVVVDGRGDSLEELVVLEVRIVASTTRK
jgi:intein/homing endonuclease